MDSQTKVKIIEAVEALRFGQVIITKKDGKIIGIDYNKKLNLKEFLLDKMEI